MATRGKRQFDVQLNDTGRALGLTATDLARQLRHAFRAEAIRQQRGRHEVTVRLRRPLAERAADRQRLCRTPSVTSAIAQVATIARGYAYTQISRTDGRRTQDVLADVEPIGESSGIDGVQPCCRIRRRYPGLRASFEGSQADRIEALGPLAWFCLPLAQFLFCWQYRSAVTCSR